MARIAGVDIPRDKRVVVSLTYVYGIGPTTARKILADCGISEDVRVKDLTEEQENAIRSKVDGIKVEGDLRREVSLNVVSVIVKVYQFVDNALKQMRVHAKVRFVQ